MVKKLMWYGNQNSFCSKKEKDYSAMPPSDGSKVASKVSAVPKTLVSMNVYVH